MTFPVTNLILKMVSAEMRDAQQYSKETKKWIPTGGQEKFFEYVFVFNDEFNEKIVLNSKQDFSKFEGKQVTAVLDWKFDNFNKKMRIPTLVDVLPAK